MTSQPLWTDSNTTLFSSIFSVAPGKVCVLFAVDLERHKYRTDNTTTVAPQAICVRRIMHEFDPASAVARSGCGWVYNVNGAKADIIVDTPITTCGAPWQLTKCRNVGIIGVPGVYRLELNDATAIGVAQVYADLYGVNDFPIQVKDLFFA